MEKNISDLNATKKIIEKDLLKCLNKFGKNLCYLKSRWNDEKEYEDFEQYKKQFKLIFEKCKLDAEIVGMFLEKKAINERKQQYQEYLDDLIWIKLDNGYYFKVVR